MKLKYSYRRGTCGGFINIFNIQHIHNNININNNNNINNNITLLIIYLLSK